MARKWHVELCPWLLDHVVGLESIYVERNGDLVLDCGDARLRIAPRELTRPPARRRDGVGWVN